MTQTVVTAAEPSHRRATVSRKKERRSLSRFLFGPRDALRRSPYFRRLLPKRGDCGASATDRPSSGPRGTSGTYAEGQWGNSSSFPLLSHALYRCAELRRGCPYSSAGFSGRADTVL
jgi:hypothetical protein